MSEETTTQAPAPEAAKMPTDGLLLMPMRTMDMDGGRVLAMLDARLQEVHGELTRFYEKRGDKGAKAKIILQIELQANPDVEGQTNLSWRVTTSIPQPKRMVFAKTKDGTILTEATPESVRARQALDSQISLFGLLGEDKGRVDPSTGEMIPESEVAGSIEPKTA